MQDIQRAFDSADKSLAGEGLVGDAAAIHVFDLPRGLDAAESLPFKNDAISKLLAVFEHGGSIGETKVELPERLRTLWSELIK